MGIGRVWNKAAMAYFELLKFNLHGVSAEYQQD
jgi:hypothetical protein